MQFKLTNNELCFVFVDFDVDLWLFSPRPLLKLKDIVLEQDHWHLYDNLGHLSLVWLEDVQIFLKGLGDFGWQQILLTWIKFFAFAGIAT